jgi:CRP-like cAMP-binding protein
MSGVSIINQTQFQKTDRSNGQSSTELPSGTDLTANQLLGALSPGLREQLAAVMEPLELKYRNVLFRPNESQNYVYFPLSGVISMLAITAEESTGVEIASVGREGMANVNLFLGIDHAQVEALVQVPGRAVRLSGEALRRFTANGGELSQMLLRYTSAFLGQLSQSVACNRLHPLEERCARWLLMMHDRAGDQFPITHEFLSNMLGVRRATVTVAAGILQKAGLIRYTRGKMTILDRAKLEEASCECYGIVRDMFERMVGTAG